MPHPRLSSATLALGLVTLGLTSLACSDPTSSSTARPSDDAGASSGAPSSDSEASSSATSGAAHPRTGDDASSTDAHTDGPHPTGDASSEPHGAHESSADTSASRTTEAPSAPTDETSRDVDTSDDVDTSSRSTSTSTSGDNTSVDTSTSDSASTEDAGPIVRACTLPEGRRCYALVEVSGGDPTYCANSTNNLWVEEDITDIAAQLANSGCAELPGECDRFECLSGNETRLVEFTTSHDQVTITANRVINDGKANFTCYTTSTFAPSGGCNPL
jgi:hypothetical protein